MTIRDFLRKADYDCVSLADDWPLFDPDAEIVTVEKPAKPEVKNSTDWKRPEMTQGG